MLRRLIERIGGRSPLSESKSASKHRVAINMRPTSSPWGGGNQWLQQMVRDLSARGYSVSFNLKGSIDCIILVDPRVGGLVGFGPEEIQTYKLRNSEVLCLHRVNECDQRKGTQFMDGALAEANKVADFTVFVSEWLRDYHAARWFDRSRPHAVIVNGADPAIFHPRGGELFEEGNVFRVVTHHWSNNWMKGFSLYQEVDRLIASGDLSETELWVIGRWPEEIQWKSAKTYGPQHGTNLATLLRQCHIHLTASLWEPGPMHPVEAAQCGLPIVYHEDGGGIVELARRYGVSFRDDVGAAIREAKARYTELRAAVLEHAPSGQRMCEAYADAIERLLA